MSLINDALQRAKEVQQGHVSSSGPVLQFRPVEPGKGAKKNPLLNLAIVLAVVLIFGAIFASRFIRENHSRSVSARETSTRSSAGEVQPAPAPAPVVSTPKASPPAAAAPTAVAAPVTNAIAVVEASAPSIRPPLPKLQAIVFSSTRPSAIINGRTLYVGSRISEYRVAAIHPNSAVLVNGTETNVLSLEEQ